MALRHGIDRPRVLFIRLDGCSELGSRRLRFEADRARFEITSEAGDSQEGSAGRGLSRFLARSILFCNNEKMREAEIDRNRV